MGHRGPAHLSCQSPWGAGPRPAAGNAAPPAGRRSGPEGQAGASAGGLAGAAASHPRRSGGPYRRAAARRRCAAAAPWRGRPGSGLWPGLNKILLFCTPEGPWPGRPQLTTRTLSACPGHGPRGLVNCGVAGLCIRHRPDGATPRNYTKQPVLFRPGPGGKRLNLWRRRFPWLAERLAPWDSIRRTPRPGARGGGGVGS